MKHISSSSIRLVVITAFILITTQSCVDHTLPEPDPCGGTVSFVASIEPIIDTSCAIPTCHNGDNGADKNWTVFANFQAKSANVKDRITRPPGASGHMPASGSITDAQIQLIVCWVDQGAQDN